MTRRKMREDEDRQAEDADRRYVQEAMSYNDKKRAK